MSCFRASGRAGAGAGDLQLSKVLATNEGFLIRGDAAGHTAADIVTQRGKLSTGSVRMARTGSGNDEQNLSAADRSLRKWRRTLCFRSPRHALFARGRRRSAQWQTRSHTFQTRPNDALQREYQMVLLGWQPDSLASEPSIQNLAAIHHVAAIPQFFGFDPHSLFSVWLPTQAELASFRRATRLWIAGYSLPRSMQV